ncbi:hydrolase [Oleiagrimonas sp.]|jgi:nicotinamidase-related amidase|uniref:hydrolase n=1 Tax=Oleiagrimonas sp. TaxID=2010330 RepID=UPI002602CE43|nr:hydrolase [Oleiagrimonas sp.]MDA3912969.1 hydrolase [Oleiagrimonas sp.]
MPTLDPNRTALVLIDLQQGIVAMPVEPHTGTEILQRSRKLAARFRSSGGLVVLVRVAFAANFADAPRQPVDQPMAFPEGGLPADWSQLADGLQQSADLVITKHQWGAFTGTELDLQLRRRGIDTIVLGGIATNFGVESTARHAWELGYAVVLAGDLCASRTRALHDMAVEHVLPRISRVVDSGDIAFEGD